MPPRATLLLCVAALLAGCSTTASLPEAAPETEPPTHTLIYVVHGDGSYLYHEGGEARRADEEAVRQARLVAEHAPDVEVLIFHQRPRRSLLGLFPRPDGILYHYRDGRLLEKASYRRAPDSTGLGQEAALYHERRHPGAEGRTFLYYGHDLEEGGGRHYHGSYPEVPFGLEELTGGLELFGAAENPFGLVALSTCNGGTPGTVAALAPLADYVLASPGNLHLSYVDSHPLHRAGSEPVEELAHEVAEWAFERLARRTETAITLALYETDRLTPALDSLGSAYEGVPGGMRGFVDCQDQGGLDAGALPGVTTWYRPPAFGPESDKSSHSGWGCPPRERERIEPLTRGN